jgi:hypothetical protein
VQFVNLIDHDEKRDAGFVVTSLCDDRGVDSSQHFAARIEPISGDPRGSRLYLEYRGGLTGRVFHGTVTSRRRTRTGR